MKLTKSNALLLYNVGYRYIRRGEINLPVIGRNDPCYCGSGKKYKKCCLLKDENKLKGGITFLPEGESFQFVNDKIHQHDVNNGVKDTALTLLAILDQFLSKKNIMYHKVHFYASELNLLVTAKNELEAYIFILKRLEQSHKRVMPPELESDLRYYYPFGTFLSRNEAALIRTITKSHLAEFALLGEMEIVDYSAMRILNTLAYEVVKEGINDDTPLWSIDITVDTDESNIEQLINWKLNFADEFQDVELLNGNIFIKWKSLDVLSNEYHKYANSLHGLEADSKNDLATVMYQEQAILEKHKHIISYSGLVSIYTGILERELRIIIELNENKKNTKLMFKAIIDYFKYSNPTAFSFLENNVSVPFNQLEKIREIRNRAAHGKTVSYDDFIYVKNFAIEQEGLKHISWEKINLEDHEVYDSFEDLLH